MSRSTSTTGSPAPRRGRRIAPIGWVLAAAAAAIALTASWRVLPRSRPQGPVILISVDTLRADHLAAYGYRGVPTPAIDALAADGVLFERAYAHSPQTLPSHVSMLSGRLPFEHGVRDNVGFTVKPDERLLPSMLRDGGFTSGGFVSAYVLREDTGIARGFDHFDARLPPSSPEIAVGELQRDGSATLAAADAWLDGLSSPRFFLFFHIYEPHSPYSPPARFAAYAPYDGEIARADEIVGGLVASLERRGLYDSALVMLLSDHGEGLGDHGEQEHGLFVYQETIRVPLVVKLPRRENAGRRVAAPVQHIDIVPTVLDLLRLPARGGLRGRSLRPLFSGGGVAGQGLYAEALYPRYHFGWSELYALTDDRYSYIRAPREELYDLREDGAQRRNLAAERESTRLAMTSALDRIRAGAGIDAPGEVGGDARERLRALGYVGIAPAPASAGAAVLPDPKDKVQVLERYRRAIALVGQGAVDDALEIFRAIVRDEPLMADVWSEIGGLSLRLGRMDEALAAYRRVVEVAPHEPAALINVADILLRLGRLDEAKAQALAAAETIPAADAQWRARAHESLAMIALARHDEEGARREAGVAHGIDGTLPMPEYVEGLIQYRAGRFEAAVEPLGKALRASADRTLQIPELRYYLGDALARLERYGEAEPLLAEEVRLFPHDLRARAALAILYRSTGRPDESDRAVAGIARVAPNPEGRALVEQLRRMFQAR